jgi:nitroreductase
MDLLKSHKTIRKYSDKSIPDLLLKGIIDTASRASTTGNMQLYSVVITRDLSIKDKLIPLHFNQPVARSAPILLTICADFNRFSKWCLFNDANPGYGNFLSFLTASTDALLFAQNICVAAEDKGLGICYLGTSTYNAKEIIEVLNLPKLAFPIATLAIGWPAENPVRADRLPLRAIIHNETPIRIIQLKK